MTSGLTQALQLVVASAVIGLGMNALRDEPLSFTEALDAGDPPPAAEPGVDLPADEPSAAVAGWEEGAFFLDVRSRADFDAHRVAGAFSLPADGFENGYFELVATLPLEIPLFVYGAGPDSHLVRRVVAGLLEYGHEQVSVMVCGLDPLVDAGVGDEAGPEGTP